MRAACPRALPRPTRRDPNMMTRLPFLRKELLRCGSGDPSGWPNGSQARAAAATAVRAPQDPVCPALPAFLSRGVGIAELLALDEEARLAGNQWACRAAKAPACGEAAPRGLGRSTTTRSRRARFRRACDVSTTAWLVESGDPEAFLDRVMHTYRGHEDLLMAQLVEKYGPEPEPSATEASGHAPEATHPRHTSLLNRLAAPPPPLRSPSLPHFGFETQTPSNDRRARLRWILSLPTRVAKALSDRQWRASLRRTTPGTTTPGTATPGTSEAPRCAGSCAHGVPAERRRALWASGARTRCAPRLGRGWGRVVRSALRAMRSPFEGARLGARAEAVERVVPLAGQDHPCPVRRRPAHVGAAAPLARAARAEPDRAGRKRRAVANSRRRPDAARGDGRRGDGLLAAAGARPFGSAGMAGGGRAPIEENAERRKRRPRRRRQGARHAGGAGCPLCRPSSGRRRRRSAEGGPKRWDRRRLSGLFREPLPEQRAGSWTRSCSPRPIEPFPSAAEPVGDEPVGGRLRHPPVLLAAPRLAHAAARSARRLGVPPAGGAAGALALGRFRSPVRAPRASPRRRVGRRSLRRGALFAGGRRAAENPRTFAALREAARVEVAAVANAGADAAARREPRPRPGSRRRRAGGSGARRRSRRSTAPSSRRPCPRALCRARGHGRGGRGSSPTLPAAAGRPQALRSLSRGAGGCLARPGAMPLEAVGERLLATMHDGTEEERASRRGCSRRSRRLGRPRRRARRAGRCRGHGRGVEARETVALRARRRRGRAARRRVPRASATHIERFRWRPSSAPSADRRRPGSNRRRPPSIGP